MQVGLTKLHAEDGPWGADRALLGFVLPVSFIWGRSSQNFCIYLKFMSILMCSSVLTYKIIIFVFAA